MCNLRFDDTNPAKEEVEYVDSIMDDVRWLGFDWEDRLFYASDYFEQLYEWADAADQARARPTSATSRPRRSREYRGTLTEPGKRQPVPRPHGRGESRPVRADEGGRVPRRRARRCARRSTWRRPTSTCATRCMYRILHATHHRTGDDVVHLSDVRLRARPCRTRSRASRTRSARWSSRTTGRSTTGSAMQLGSLPSAADRVRAAQSHLHAC